LITGGNKGLGYETGRRLAEIGHRVILGVRDAERGAQAAERLGVAWTTLDVTSDDSVAAAAAEIGTRFGALDVLVNNAGISGANTAMENFDGPAVLAVLDTNTVGIVRTVHAFLPLLRESAAPVIVNVSSGLGSFDVRADTSRIEHQIPSLGYSASKAAVNMLTSIYAQFIPEIRINAVDPGYTDRFHRQLRTADGYRGNRHHRGHGVHRSGRTHWNVLRSPRCPSVVKSYCW
jgi:NAD(P)-dependent dehydrogenase (short-subunit alcohol dehydrogenase family)